MNTRSTSAIGRVLRFGSVAALSAAFVASASAPVFAQDYHQDRGDQRDHQDQGDRQDQRDHRESPFRHRSLGHNRYQYTYNGHDYAYTVDNRRGDLDPREVSQRASQNGYQQGLQEGSYDGSGGASKPNPAGHGAYQFGLDGWNEDMGSGLTYQRAYRQSYVRGYNEGFARSRRSGRRPY